MGFGAGGCGWRRGFIKQHYVFARLAAGHQAERCENEEQAIGAEFWHGVSPGTFHRRRRWFF
ncbi:hypothetical protein OCEANICA350_12715 [Oceanicaulis sp. 350]|nr:hypothetical protein OCEANICA350_12715 [Oceanicaulis sp. 350]